MTTSTLTLADFLLARLSDDEAVARAAAADVGWAPPGPERVQSGARWTTSYHVVVRSRSVAGAPLEKRPIADCGTLGLSPAKHIARHDPARVLAEVEAKRRIVEAWGGLVGDNEEQAWALEHGDRSQAVAITTLRLLALPYAGHEAYDEAWRP
jgi:hypothetical protein